MSRRMPAKCRVEIKFFHKIRTFEGPIAGLAKMGGSEGGSVSAGRAKKESPEFDLPGIWQLLCILFG